jgi:N-acetylglucosaminyldiphosphoundecaprenol N-acetyl-beta-D-mannosaminyltransferase
MAPAADFASVREPAEGAVPARQIDFTRPRVCVLGLPFDPIGIPEAVERVRADAFAGRRCWIATPNLNFAIAARGDAAFRQSVLRSDLSLVDGMPLVWMSRALGAPLPQRVAGSDLFLALQAHPGPPLKVYVFGGPPGVAARAAERINASGGGVYCVGADEAGYGGVEAMSDSALIERINRSGAHFIFGAVGAQKGQAWFAYNAARLVPPGFCHLGAGVNVSAGTVGRAPPWVRRSGLEWAFRIKEEPALWRRYFRDGLSAAELVAKRVLPAALAARSERAIAASTAAPVEIDRSEAGIVLRPTRAAGAGAALALRSALAECVAEPGRVSVDLSQAAGVGNEFAAALLVAEGWFGARGGFAVTRASAPARAGLRRLSCEQLLAESATR